jgi:FecR protein
VIKTWKALPFAVFLLIGAAHAQTQNVGVVSGIRGDATVRHERAGQAQPLKFKDNVFWLDTLSTGSDAQLRLLIMQKSVVTMKELTQLQLREDVIGSDQTKKKSVVDLTSGAVRVVVDKDMLKSGGGYEVRTNMAVAAIRGSDLYGTADKDKTEFCAGPGSSVTAIHQNPAVGQKELNNLQCASILPDRMDIRTISLNDYRLLTDIGPRGGQNGDHGGKAEGKISPPPGGGPPPGGPNNPYNNNGCLLCKPNNKGLGPPG